MKTLLPLSILFLTTFSITAQHLQTVSHFTAGGAQADAIQDIKTDTAGNVYITGHFTGTVDFDPGPGTFNLSTATGHTQPDAFIQKLDANGNLLWAKSFGGNTDGFIAGRTIFVDDSANVYLTGWYYRDIRFTPGGNLWSSGSTSAIRPFLVKLDAQGNVVWGKAWQNSNNSHAFYASDVSADRFGNVYLFGLYQGTVDFDPSMSFQFRTSSAQDGFLLKLTASGEFRDVITIGGGVGQNRFAALKPDSVGNLYIGGFFRDTVDFDFGSGVLKKGTIGFFNGFVMKVDTAFGFKWVNIYQGATSSSSSLVEDMEFDGIQNIYITGRFSSTTNFSFDPNNPNPITPNGSSDVFVQKLDTAGNIVWLKTFGGASLDLPRDISLSNDGRFVIAGRFGSTVNFNPDGPPHNITNVGQTDAFVYMADTSGNFITATGYGNAQDNHLFGVSFSIRNSIYTGGVFENTLNINPSSTPLMVTSAGGTDMLFMELQLCTSDSTNLNITACGWYTVPSGSTTHTASGVYYDTIPDALGCDSILEINLTLLPAMDTSVTHTATSLTANATGVGYQWFDCQTEQIIPGETGQTFVPTSAGQYAVIIDDGTCTDTSACKTMHNIGLTEYAQIPVKLYPNPTDGLLHIQSPQAWHRAEITDLTGRTLLTSKEPNRPLDLTKLPTGVYLVKVYFENGVSVEKVVRE